MGLAVGPHSVIWQWGWQWGPTVGSGDSGASNGGSQWKRRHEVGAAVGRGRVGASANVTLGGSGAGSGAPQCDLAVGLAVEAHSGNR